MASLFDELDREWATLAACPRLTRTTRHILELAGGAADWHEAQHWMRAPGAGAAAKNRVLAALIRDATIEGDRAAARIALALLTPGIRAELARHARRPNLHHHSAGEVDAIAIEAVWDRICDYPLHRRGNVAANVLLDLRQRLCRRPRSVTAVPTDTPLAADPYEADDDAMPADLMVLVEHARRDDQLDEDAAEIILDTRIRGVACGEAARARAMSDRTFRRRQRAAEAKLAAHARRAYAA